MPQLQKIFPYSVWFQSHVYGMVSGDFFHCGFSSTVAGSSHYVQQVYPSLIRFRKVDQIRYGGSAPLRQSESRRTNARNVNFTNSLRWPIFISARLTKPKIKNTPLIDPCLIFSDLSASQLIMVFEELCCSDAILVDSLSNFLKYFI